MQKGRQQQTDDVQPMDPIALTLAVWLGLIVMVSGVVRVAENASAQAALMEAAGKTNLAQPLDDTQPIVNRLVAFGS